MTTIINTPTPAPAAESDSGGMTLIMGIIVLIGLAMLIFYIGIPALRRMGTAQINLPATQVVMPAKIDVNVVQPK